MRLLSWNITPSSSIAIGFANAIGCSISCRFPPPSPPLDMLGKFSLLMERTKSSVSSSRFSLLCIIKYGTYSQELLRDSKFCRWPISNFFAISFLKFVYYAYKEWRF